MVFVREKPNLKYGWWLGVPRHDETETSMWRSQDHQKNPGCFRNPISKFPKWRFCSSINGLEEWSLTTQKVSGVILYAWSRAIRELRFVKISSRCTPKKRSARFGFVGKHHTPKEWWLNASFSQTFMIYDGWKPHFPIQTTIWWLSPCSVTAKYHV